MRDYSTWMDVLPLSLKRSISCTEAIKNNMPAHDELLKADSSKDTLTFFEIREEAREHFHPQTK